MDYLNVFYFTRLKLTDNNIVYNYGYERFKKLSNW